MNSESLQTAPSITNNLVKSSSGFWSGIAEKIVLQALTRMTQGYLTLRLPSGEIRMLGDSGSSIHATVQIHNTAFFHKVLLYGHIGFSESYMDGDWDTDSITNVISWAILNVEISPILEGSTNKSAGINLLGLFNSLFHWLRPNSLQKSSTNIRDHYDLGNDFFAIFLDPTRTYSSARFTHPEQTLESAQFSKYEALCRKLRLKATDHVLEIGTGWGGFSEYVARTHGCRITTVTISQAQYDFALDRIEKAGLSDCVSVQLCDYRNITGQYDKIASIEMLEAVGDAYMETFFGQCHKLLKKDGILAMQYITCPDSRYQLLKNNVDFIQKHIFPGSLIPSAGRVNQALNKTGDLSILELEDLGNSYARTLQLWRQTFDQRLDRIRALGFDERFIRKWDYYFDYCRAAFEMRNLSVVQVAYTRPNNLSLSVARQASVGVVS